MRKIRTGLYRLREANGLTIRDMANFLDLNIYLYQALEKEPQNLTLPYIIKLTDLFNVTARDLK